MTDAEAHKVIPTLREWLGDGARANGFEEYVEAVLQGENSPDPDIAASHRILKTLMIAMVEAGRIEDQHGSDKTDTAMRMGRGLGFAYIAALASCGRADLPLHDVVDMTATLAREGANLFAVSETIYRARGDN